MNLSERLRVDKELFSGEQSSYENTLTFRFFSVFYYKCFTYYDYITFFRILCNKKMIAKIF